MKMSTSSSLLAALALCAWLPTTALAQAAAPATPLQSVVLDSGVTLADWVRIVRAREPSPSIATGAQAVQYVQRYGAYRELIDIAWRAASHKDLQRDAVGSDNAAERLAAVMQARRALGDWPTLLMTSAAAKAYLGDATGANEDLRRWMTIAPASHRERERVAEALLSVAQKPDAVIMWLTQTGIGAMPVALRRPVDPYFDKFAKDIARARECLGPVATYDDLAVLQEGRMSHNGENQAVRTEFRITQLGLSDVKATLLSSPIVTKFEIDETLTSMTGGHWSRKKWRNDNWTFTTDTWTRNIECSVPLLPASKGKQVQFSWETEGTTETNGPEGIKTVPSIFRHRMSFEFLSDVLTPEELTAMESTGLRLRLPADYRGRFYRAKWRSSFEDITPSRPGGQRLQPHQSEAEGLFVEGPNVSLMLRGAMEQFYKPGSMTWTLTRPGPNQLP